MQYIDRYTRFALVREMLETPGIIRGYKPFDLKEPLESLRHTKKLFLTGEGSSRLFPAKNAIFYAMQNHPGLRMMTEGARQAAEYDLKDFTLIGASNSGKTKELIELFRLRDAHKQFGLTAYTGTPLGNLSDRCYYLSCGKEDAVAATKSVMEQALFYIDLVMQYHGHILGQDLQDKLADEIDHVLQMKIDPKIVQQIARSSTIYFSGRNIGVAEEATLKVNEITRKRSGYLEGTYLVHGVEESLSHEDSIILVDPFPEEETKIKEVLADDAGAAVFAISNRQTIFPTLMIPHLKDLDGFLQLASCWNLLVEVGIAMDIDLDKPIRARKIGNAI